MRAGFSAALSLNVCPLSMNKAGRAAWADGAEAVIGAEAEAGADTEAGADA